MSVREQHVTVWLLQILVIAALTASQLNTAIVSADEMPPLYVEHYLAAVYRELPQLPPCPTPVPGKPIVC